MAARAAEHFYHLGEYRVAVCKECRHAVWPDQVQGHLQGRHHGIGGKDAEAIADEIRQFPGLIRFPAEFEVPAGVDRPIPELPVYADGLICKLQPDRCRYICRNEKAIKKHWRVEHQWSAGRQKGGSGKSKGERFERRFQGAARQVYCQRFFTSRHGSQYFEVRQPVEEENRADEDGGGGGSSSNDSSRNTWARAWQQMQKRIEEAEKAAAAIIQDAERDQANPWLERTQWQQYLVDKNREDLLQAVREPGGGDDSKNRRRRAPGEDEEDDPYKPIEMAVWTAMEDVSRISQKSVAKRAGVSMRMQAIRTEKYQNRYQPLQPYMDEESIKDRVRPWQQILMFFIRTQREHDWDSPEYKFTRSQEKAFTRLMNEAERVVGGEDGSGTEDEDDDGDDGEINSTDEEENDNGDGDGNNDGDGDDDDDNQPQKLTRIQRACLDFCMELLNQRFAAYEYESALVCAAAVLGVDPMGDSWRGPDTYTSILSALMKVAHFMVIQKAFEIAAPAEEDERYSPSARPCDFEDSGYEGSGGSGGSGGSSSGASSGGSGGGSRSNSRNDRTGQPGRSSLQWVNKMMDDFMVRGSDSPMQWFLDLRAYGMKIHFNTTAKGHVGWRSRDILEYKNVSFSMTQFRGMVHRLAQGTTQVLVEDLLFCRSRQEVPAVPWHSMHDDPTNGRRGWNFLQDQRNRFPVDGRSWLFERIMENSKVRRRFTRQGAASGLSREAALDWMGRVAAFKEKLLVLMHITGGQPARGPEILSIRHSNTAEAGHRHIFIEDGMVVFVTRYHKGYALQGDVKIIHRYLPREVGELLVLYLWLVLPFQQRIEVLIRGKQTQQGQEEGRGQARVQGQAEVQGRAEVQGKRRRRRQQQQQKQKQQKQPQCPPLSAHLWATEPEGKKWTTERMRQAIKRETAAGLGHEITVRAYRDIAIAISRQWIRGPTAFRQDDGERDDGEQRQDEDGMAAAIADAQAGHTSHVAGIVYARGVMEQLGWVAGRRQKFRACSIDWHRFLGFESTGQADERHEQDEKDGWVGGEMMGKKRKRCPFEDEADEERLNRRIRLRKMNAEEQLKQLVGKQAVFRSVQKPAMEAIKAGHSPVVAVMPTGAGKSVLFMLPAWAEPGSTTVVVVPLKSLRKDMKRRCDETGVRCAVWDGRRQPDAESIVLVTPEAAVGEEFGTFLKRIRRTRQLDRIVVDECHVVLNDRVDFRKHLQQLGKLAGAETQMVLLTATLPPAEEGRLYKRMGWTADEVTMFRGSTVRKNVQYRVVGRKRSGRKEQEDLVTELVKQQLTASAEGKVVVYCKTKVEVERLVRAGRFVCEAFHADISDQRKDEVLEDFRAGRERVVVATSALGMGIDIPDIRLIVHAGEPRSMMDYGQESGRAGRDGRRSEAVVVRGGGGEVEDKLVGQYTDPASGQCRRIIMDEYFDGRRGRISCEDGEELCDNCGGDGERRGVEVDEVEVEQARREQIERGQMERERMEKERMERERAEREKSREIFRRQEQQRARPYVRQAARAQEERQELEEVERQLRRWRRICGVCKAAGWPVEHDVGDCTTEIGRRAAEERQRAKRTIKYDRYSGCFRCGAPQSVCDGWESNDSGGWRRTGRECQNSGVLLGALYGIKYGYGAVWRRWLQQMAENGVDVEQEESVVGYLGRKRDTVEVESNNLVWEFLWLARRVESRV